MEPRTRKYVIRYGFLSFARKYKKQLLNTRLDSFKNVSKKWSIKQVKSQGKRWLNCETDENPRNIEKNNYSARKKRWNTNQIEKSIIKLEHYCTKNCGKKWVKINNLSSGQYSVNRNIRLKT